MQMHFAFSNKVTLLFDFWTVQTLTGLLLSCVVVLLLTIFYELSKVWQTNLLTRVLLTLPLTPDTSLSPSLITDPEASSNNSDPLLSPDPLYPDNDFPIRRPSPVRHVASPYRWWCMHSSGALLHATQVFLGYSLMLCVMTYNSAIFIAVIFGSGLGYYLAFPLLAMFPPKPHLL